MTPWLRLLEHWLPPLPARVVLALAYAAMMVSIVLLSGYTDTNPPIYLDLH